MNALPESKGAENASSGRAMPPSPSPVLRRLERVGSASVGCADGEDDDTGKSRQPTVKRGSCRISRSP